MGKTLAYVIVLALLGGAVWYFFFKEQEPFQTKEAGFNFKDSSAIAKIFLARPAGESIKLERTEKGWILNDSLKARKASLTQLFMVLYKQQAVQPVSTKLHNELVKNFATDAIKVELYDKNGKPLRIFYVGAEVGNTHGSFMLMQGAPKPYIVQIPNHNGYLSAFYEPNIVDWRDRGLIAIKADDLREVQVRYADKPINSFTYTQQNGQVSVATEPSLMKPEAFNKRRAALYSTFFEYVNAEAYLNGTPGLDSIMQRVPKRATLSVKDANSNATTLEIYWMPLDRRSKNLDVNLPGVPEGYDGDKMLAVINGGKDTVMIQTNTFDKILRKGYEFYTADEALPKHEHELKGMFRKK